MRWLTDPCETQRRSGLRFGRKCPGRHTDDVQVDRNTPQVTGSSTRVRVRIAAMQFRVTGEKGAGPSDRVRLPTRRKPSKGQRAGGKAARARAVFGWQRHALRKPGEPQVRYRDATGPNSQAGGNRRSGEKPQGRNVNLGRHAEVQTHASAWGEWTAEERTEEGETRISREDGSAGNSSKPARCSAHRRGVKYESVCCCGQRRSRHAIWVPEAIAAVTRQARGMRQRATSRNR